MSDSNERPTTENPEELDSTTRLAINQAIENRLATLSRIIGFPAISVIVIGLLGGYWHFQGVASHAAVNEARSVAEGELERWRREVQTDVIEQDLIALERRARSGIGQMEVLTKTIARIETDVAERRAAIEVELNELQASYGVLAEGLRSLQKDQQATVAAMEQLDWQGRNLESSFAEVHSQLETQKAELRDRSGAIDALASDLRITTARLDSMKEGIGSYATDLPAIRDAIFATRQQGEDLEQLLCELQTRAADADLARVNRVLQVINQYPDAAHITASVAEIEEEVRLLVADTKVVGPASFTSVSIVNRSGQEVVTLKSSDAGAGILVVSEPPAFLRNRVTLRPNSLVLKHGDATIAELQTLPRSGALFQLNDWTGDKRSVLGINQGGNGGLWLHSPTHYRSFGL